MIIITILMLLLLNNFIKIKLLRKNILCIKFAFHLLKLIYNLYTLTLLFYGLLHNILHWAKYTLYP